MARHKRPTTPRTLSPSEAAHLAHAPLIATPKEEAEIRALSGAVRRYLRHEVIEQRAIVERLMVEGATCRQIGRILRSTKDKDGNLRWPNITNKTVMQRMAQVRVLRKKDAEEGAREQREELRDHMVERLHRMRQAAMAQVPPNFKAAIMCEKELAKLKGLYAPAKVEIDGNLNHSHAMVGVIAGLDPDLAADLLEEARQTEVLAAKARHLLGSGAETDSRVTVDVEVAAAE